MKILHIIGGLVPAAGTTVFCETVCDCQAKAGNECAIATKDDYATYQLTDWDIVHIHAIWSPFNVRVMRDCIIYGIPFVVSIHGCLMPRVFQKGRVKKWIFWYLFLRPLLMKANAIHCTSEAEKDACIKLGLPGPFIVAPLGVNLPSLVGDDHLASRGSDSSVGARVPSRPQRNVLFLGRLSEEKGLLNLLEAWKQLQNEGVIHCSTFNLQPSTSKLILAGPDWLGYKSKLDAKIATDHIEGVVFTGLVQGEAKDKLYREADLFVLPSPMENFSMVVLEALAYGVPVIATKGTPWQELEGDIHSQPQPSTSTFAHGKCGWWIDQGVEPLKNALREALATSASDLHIFGQNGRALAERKYQWPAIADKLLICYREILK